MKTNTIPSHFQKNNRQKMWNNMKIGGSFSVKSVVASIEVPQTTAYAYIRPLQRAGYLKLTQTNGNKYRLVRDTGRLAPVVRKTGCWDKNLMQLFAFDAAAINEA